jgi:signal peptidase II
VKHLRLLGLAIAGLVIVLDQISKPLMRDWLSAGDIQLTSFLSLVKAWNHGVGFSLLTMTLPSGPYVLSALALAIATGMLVWLFRVSRPIPALALGLIIGGALGNVVDRLRLGAVFDFVDVHLGGYHWPAFNLADSALSIGVVLLIIDGLFDGRGKSKNPAHLEG